MEFLVAIMMYLGILSPCSSYTDAEIKCLMQSNMQEINDYNAKSTDGTMTVTVKKTVWDHETF